MTYAPDDPSDDRLIAAGARLAARRPCRRCDVLHSMRSPWCSPICRRLDEPAWRPPEPRQPRPPKARHYYCGKCGVGIVTPRALTGRRAHCVTCDPENGHELRADALVPCVCRCGHEHQRTTARRCSRCGSAGHVATRCPAYPSS